jgi:hypothetical protein
LAPGIVEVVQPEHASYHTGGVVYSEEVLVIFFNVEDNGSCDLDFCQKILIPQNEKDFASLLILATELVMVLNGKILFSQCLSWFAWRILWLHWWFLISI